VAAALAHELAPARGADAALDRLIAQLPQRMDDATDEIAARALARDVALAVQAALLRQHASDAVFDAFCASRIAGGGADVFGMLPAGIDFDSIIARAMPH